MLGGQVWRLTIYGPTILLFFNFWSLSNEYFLSSTYYYFILFLICNYSFPKRNFLFFFPLFNSFPSNAASVFLLAVELISFFSMLNIKPNKRECHSIIFPFFHPDITLINFLINILMIKIVGFLFLNFWAKTLSFRWR